MGQSALSYLPKLNTTVDAADGVTGPSESNVEMRRHVLIQYDCGSISISSFQAVLTCHGCEKLRIKKNVTPTQIRPC